MSTAPSSFTDDFTEIVRSNQAGIWVTSDVYDDAEIAIRELTFERYRQQKAEGKNPPPTEVWVYVPADGLYVHANPDKPESRARVGGPNDRHLPGFFSTLGRLRSEEATGKRIMCLVHDLHRLQDQGISAIRETCREATKNGAIFLVGFAPPTQKPFEELRPLFWVLPYQLPTFDELKLIVDDCQHSAPDDSPVKEHDEVVLDAAAQALRGLTREQSKAALVRSGVRLKRYDRQFLWETKCKLISESGRLEIRQPTLTREDVVGLGGVIDFASAMLEDDDPDLKSRGIFLCGVAGSGKSLVSDVIGAVAGVPTARLNLGALFQKYVGDTEENLRETLRIAEKLAPLVLQIDEFEKVMPRADSEGGSGDVGRRLLGAFLTWWQDCKEHVFIAATANDATSLSGPILRRFDKCYFFDLPSKAARYEAWKLYLRKYKDKAKGAKIEKGAPPPCTDEWNIADIEKCCRLSAKQGLYVHEVAETIVPIGKIAKREIEKMREWASGSYLDADTGKLYQGLTRESKASKGRRETSVV